MAGTQSRAGRHKDGNTLFGAYISPEAKAVAVLAARRLGITYTDLIVDGLRAAAVRAGVMRGGKIAPACRDEYAAALAEVREAVRAGKGTRTRRGCQ